TAARPVRGLRLAGRRDDGHAPARRAGPDRRSRLQRPRRRRLCARAGLVAVAGGRAAEACRMNPEAAATDVIEYLDALLADGPQPGAIDPVVVVPGVQPSPGPPRAVAQPVAIPIAP